MPIVIVDGPEKAGKTTLINALVRELVQRDIPAERMHWGPVSPDDRVYSEPLRRHCQDLGKVWIWDRCYPSEHIYGRLLGRDRRLSRDPWLGEWLHGRAVQVAGVRVILTGPDSNSLEVLRDETDLKVQPHQERTAYIEYAARFGWTMIENNHTQQSLEWSIDTIMAELFSKEKYCSNQWTPPKFAGPPDARVAVVGDNLSGLGTSDEWLPFASYSATQLGREFGDDAFNVLWTNVTTCDPQLLRDKETIIACGSIASDWCRREIKGGSNQRLISIPHPWYLYRFSDGKAYQQLNYFRQVVQSLKPL